MNIEPHLKLLSDYNQELENYKTELSSLIQEERLRKISEERASIYKNREVEIGLNFFVIISEYYHHENFHSDILKAFLDPKGKHDEKYKYLHLFVSFLRRRGAKINPTEYVNANVSREENRIDLLIADPLSKKAIIIENKINGARDMHQPTLPGRNTQEILPGQQHSSKKSSL